MNSINGDYFKKRNNNDIKENYTLFYKCKIKKSRMVPNAKGNKIFADDNSMIPYRLIKDHLDRKL